MEWLIVWCGEILNKYKVQPDGRTPWERRVGHKARQPLPQFGETVMFRTIPDKGNTNKLDTDWGIGVFWGVAPRTGELIITNGDEVYRCRTVRRMVKEKANDKGMLKKQCGL